MTERVTVYDGEGTEIGSYCPVDMVRTIIIEGAPAVRLCDPMPLSAALELTRRCGLDCDADEVGWERDASGNLRIDVDGVDVISVRDRLSVRAGRQT